MTKELQLLDQIIEMAEAQQKELNELNLKLHRASKTLGDTALVYYLGVLKELLTSQPTKTLDLKGKTLTVALGIEGRLPNSNFYY